MFKIQRVNGELRAFHRDKLILTKKWLVDELTAASPSLSSKVEESGSFTSLAKSNTHDESILQTHTASLATAEDISLEKIGQISIDEVSPLSEEAINTLNNIEEIRQGSITPTTFDSREFENNIDDWYYKDKYKYQDNKVTRFGINVFVLPDPSEMVFMTIEPSDASDSASETSSAKGSNPSASKKTPSSNGKKPVILRKYYELEIRLLQKAIECLLDDENNKTVVVDIFDQEDGALKIDQAFSKIKTHAVLLYKNPIMSASVSIEGAETKAGSLKDDRFALTKNTGHEIVVIDPSNSEYSAHLANLTKTHITNPYFEKLSAPKKSIQIYSTPTGVKTGYEFHQYRDCIDVAIKLGFWFNKVDIGLVINTKEIKKLDLIRKITNQLKLDDNIIDPTLINRIKQTSDIKRVEAFNKLEMVVKHNLDEVLKRDLSKYDLIYDLHHQILARQNTSKIILGELLGCNTACIGAFVAEHDELVKLVEEIDSFVELGGVS